MIPYAKHHVDQDDEQRVLAAMRSGTITRGPLTAAFEEALASYCGATHCVLFNSATSALSAAYVAAGISSFDTLYTTPNSFIGSIAYPVHLGVPIRFIDIDPTTGLMDLNQLTFEPKSRGQAVITAVHYGAHLLDMERLDGLLKMERAVVIEDASHAIGACYPDGQRVGSCPFSSMTIFSFHAAKTITTCEGGAVTTNDPQLAKRLRLYRDNGIERTEERHIYNVLFASGNYHLGEMGAALGLSQLSKIDRFVERRRALLERYRANFPTNCGVELLAEPLPTSAPHLFVVRVKKGRDALLKRLADSGIGSQVHYIPLYQHGALASYTASCPQMELFHAEALSLPLFYDLSDVEQDQVLAALAR